MQVYPTTPAPLYPYTITPVWRTLLSEFETGSEQRRSKWVFPVYDVNLQYPVLSATNSALLWAFYMARKGSAEAFWFYDLYSSAHIAHYVGVGNGTTDIFDLPGKSTSSRTLYVDGSVVSSGFAYLTGGGDGSSDRVDFETAPALGAIITVSFTGYLRAKVRFEEDRLDRENFTINLFKYGIKLKGVK